MNLRQTLMKKLWQGVVAQGDTNWIDEEIQRQPTNNPCGDLPTLLKEMLDKGVDPKTITRLVRIQQYSTLFHVCYTLDEPDNNQYQWGIFGGKGNGETGLDTKTMRSVECLHEEILIADPTGNEMRPPEPEPDFSVKIL